MAKYAALQVYHITNVCANICPSLRHSTAWGAAMMLVIMKTKTSY